MYRIVCGEDPREVEQKVTELIRQGWCLSSGFAVVQCVGWDNPDGRGSHKPVFWYSQAMFRASPA
jgi:hypothetical protein